MDTLCSMNTYDQCKYYHRVVGKVVKMPMKKPCI